MGAQYPIKINNFEGPLDLLFHLIERNKFNIYDIPINEITDQYMEYLYAMQELDLDIASDFLVMASTLLHIKSRLLLPIYKENESEEDEEDPREALILQLVQYKMFKEFSLQLRQRGEDWRNVFYRFPEMHKHAVKNERLKEARLLNAFERLLLLHYEEVNKEQEKKVETIVKRERVSLRAKIKQVLNILKKKVSFKFSEFFSVKKHSKPEVVTGFLALLELAKQNEIQVKQQQNFDEIFVYRKKEES